jgi:surface protein
MGRMFEGNSAFNQPINNWDVSNVDEMWYMFYNASNFNQSIGNWDVSSVSQCVGFSYNTPQWTLPQPYFTSCIP